MSLLRCLAVGASAALVLSLPAGAEEQSAGHDPLKFFEGRTESVSTVKVMLKKSYQSRAMGVGKIRGDGTLDLVQRVERAGHPPETRQWIIRRTGPGRFSGTMSQAVGPVTIERVGERYRFRFKMKGNLSVEQWLTPQPGWRSASNSISVRRFGIKVGSSEGVIRKL